MDLDKIVLEMIARGGAAKAAVYEALDSYIDGNRDVVNKHLKDADEHLAAAHECQRQVLQEWARMRTEPVNNQDKGNSGMGLSGPLWMHVLDIIMTAMTEKNLVERLIELFDKRVPGASESETPPQGV